MIEDPFRHLRGIIEQQDKIRKFIEPHNRIQQMLEPTQRMLESTRRIMDSSRQFVQINDSIQRIRAFEPKIPIINPAIKLHAERMNSIQERIDLFNKNLPICLVSIASYGWYLDFQTDMDLSVRLAKDIENNNIEQVDSYLLDFYESNFDTIIEKLKTNHKKRIDIFDEIKHGLKNNLYNLTIPLILTQIDGICYDWTKKLFFIKNKKNEKNPYMPKVSNELIELNSNFMKAFLAPFFNDAPIFAHENKLELYPIEFNRHKVLHGLDTEFGTKINCLKAISLLSYCEDVLTRIISDSNENK